MLATTAVLNGKLGEDNCDFVLLLCNENVAIEQLHKLYELCSSMLIISKISKLLSEM